MNTLNKASDETGHNKPEFLASLREAIESEQAGQSHGAVGRLLHQEIPALRQAALSHSDQGIKIAARFAKSIDEIVIALVGSPSFGAEIAVCAIGGYGRGKLAPHSDIDLLVLHRNLLEAQVQRLSESIFYPLWDSGMKVGHSVHTAKSAVDFASEDMIARTAFLDVRLITGSRKLLGEFQNQYEKLRKKSKNKFVAAKLAEQATRQARADETRYLVEPDVKEGKGGLRDLQTIGWLYKYVFGGAIGETKAVDKLLDPLERRALNKAERFLWSVRVQLHDFSGRPEEKLSFEVQPEIAARLGYADRPDMTAAERLMKHYFVNAVEVGRLTRVLCTRLEESRTIRIPHLPKLLPKKLQSDEAPGKPNLRIRNGRLDFESAAKAKRRPRDLFRFFRAYSKAPQYDFHPDALAIVADHSSQVKSEIRNDPVIAKLFAAIISASSNPARTLRVMTETGILGKYVPTFGALMGRIDYGLYRRFTLDESILRSISVLTQIRNGELKIEHPLASTIIGNSKDLLPYYLAVFLHESVWSLKGKSPIECEKLIVRITTRLGLDDDTAATVGWAAANHLLMVRTAERRNLTEEKAISTFAHDVKTRARLDLMLVLSVCHLRTVSLNSWDDLVRRQLTELYQATLTWLEKGQEAVQQRLIERAENVRKETKRQLSEWDEKAAESFLERLSDTMLRQVDPDILVRFAHLVRAADKDSADVAVTITPVGGDYEAIIYADDRAGLIADLAGAVADAGMSVRSMQALTTDAAKALDVFIIQPPTEAVGGDPAMAKRLHAALHSAAQASSKKALNFQRRLGDRRSIFSVTPAVRIDMEGSEEATIFETEGLDRPGLLYDLATAFGEMDATIISAHVATYGERAVDAFYILDGSGGKFSDQRLINGIKKRLIHVLSAGSDS